MKITINREHCVDGLQKAGNVTPAKSVTVMLKTTWIRTDRRGKSITLMASNGYTEYLGTYPAEVEKDGFVSVYGKSVADLLRTLPEGSVNMFTVRRSHSLDICQGNRLYKLPAGKREWFQSLIPFPGTKAVSWSGEELLDIIDHVFFCIPDDEDSPLGCLCIHPGENDGIDFWGLSSSCASLVRISNSALHAKLPKEGILIQKKYPAGIRRLISPGEIEIVLTPRRFFIRNRSGRDMVSVPLAQFGYPDYSVFFDRMKADTCSIVRVSRSGFSDALARCLIFNTRDENSVAISIGKDSLTIASSGKSTGSAAETIAADCREHGGRSRLRYQGTGRTAFPLRNRQPDNEDHVRNQPLFLPDRYGRKLRCHRHARKHNARFRSRGNKINFHKYWQLSK